MKGKWCDTNLMTNELEFFLVRKEHMTVYESKWQLDQKATVAQDKQETVEVAVPLVKAPASGSSPPTGPKPRKEAQIDDQEQTDPVSSGQEVHAVRNGRAKAGASGNPKRPKTNLEVMMSRTEANKKMYHTITGLAESIIMNIKNRHGWTWAFNEQNLGALESKLEKDNNTTSLLRTTASLPPTSPLSSSSEARRPWPR